MSTKEIRPRPVEGSIGRDLGDEYLFCDQEGGRIHTLNETAREIYLLCDGNRTTVEIARIIAERFRIDGETARTDVEETVASLIGSGFLRK
jgi:hypothetical protein